MKKMGVIGWIVSILLIIGGLNWALVGIFGFDVVQYIFISVPVIARIIYILVGIAALFKIYFIATKNK